MTYLVGAAVSGGRRCCCPPTFAAVASAYRHPCRPLGAASVPACSPRCSPRWSCRRPPRSHLSPAPLPLLSVWPGPVAVLRRPGVDPRRARRTSMLREPATAPAAKLGILAMRAAPPSLAAGAGRRRPATAARLRV